MSNAPGKRLAGSALPQWQAHTAPDYDAVMMATCADLADRIASDQEFRLTLLRDPRDCHRVLFERFAPLGYADYAGTYRGTPGTPLEHRPIHAPCVLNPQNPSLFLLPTLYPSGPRSCLRR